MSLFESVTLDGIVILDKNIDVLTCLVLDKQPQVLDVAAVRAAVANENKICNQIRVRLQHVDGFVTRTSFSLSPCPPQRAQHKRGDPEKRHSAMEASKKQTTPEQADRHVGSKGKERRR